MRRLVDSPFGKRTDITQTTKNIPRKQSVANDGDGGYEVLERELEQNRETRKENLKLRHWEHHLSNGRLEGDMKDREHNEE